MFGRAKSVFWLALCLLLLPVSARATLDLAVEASPDPAEPGDALRVFITVTNTANTPSGVVTVELPYPDDLASLSESLLSDGGTCPNVTCDTNETVLWNLGMLGAGEGITIDLPPHVASGASAPPDGTVITFAAEAFEDSSSTAVAEHDVTVRRPRVFDLAIDDNRDPVPAGQSFTYEVTFGNRSAETTTDTTLTFPLPAGTTFVSASDGGTLMGGTVRWMLGDGGTLVGREGGRRTVTVRAGAGLGEGSLLQPAGVRITGEGDFLMHETRATAVTRIENGIRLLMGVTANPDPAWPGESLRAAITVSNPTTSFVENVIVRLRYPTGLASLSESLVSDGGACPNVTCDTDEQVFWSLGTLPPGRGATVTLPPSIAAPPGGTVITLPVSVDADGQSRVLERQSLIVREIRLLDLAAEPTRSPVSAGDRVTYNLVYGNRSAETLLDGALHFPLPVGTSFVSATGGGTVASRVVSWDLGILTGREGGQRQVTVSVNSGASEGNQLVVDPATIRGQGTFLDHESRARSHVRVENDTRLDLAVTVDRDPVIPNEMTSVRITVTNRSPIDFANGVTLRLRYPEGLASLSESLLIDGSCPNVTCDPREVVFFDLGNLPPGGGAVVELPPSVAAGAPGGSVITVPVQVDAADRSRTTSSHPVVVRESRIFGLAVDTARDPVALGSTVVYDLTFGNRSNSATTGSTLRFPVPAGATFLGASDGGTLVGNAVIWNLGGVPAHRAGRRRVAVRPSTGAGPGAMLRLDHASITGNGPLLPHQSRARDALRGETVTPSLLVDATPEPVLRDTVIDTQLVVGNPAPSFLFGAVLQLRYPSSLFSLSESLVSDGGFCPNVTCDAGELVTWNLGDMNPGATIDVDLPPTVRDDVPEGSLVRYWAHLFADNFGTAVHTRTIPIGDDFDDAGPLDLEIFGDGFESGDTSSWSMTVP